MDRRQQKDSEKKGKKTMLNLRTGPEGFAPRRWEPAEGVILGPEEENPFLTTSVSGILEGPLGKQELQGFYDGEGRYIVRFMPQMEGPHKLTVSADFLSGPMTANFVVGKAAEGNHGPVHVAKTHHFAYADGTPYISLGTTCYVWPWQTDEVIEQTLDTLSQSCFNKIRFCIFPKHYPYNLSEPRSYPYVGTPMDSSVLTDENFLFYGPHAQGNHWQFDRFNPSHFRHLEMCIRHLMKLGIQADIILFHPYDRWGFSCMGREADLLYIRYVVARLSAFPNVWWSLANEYDLLQEKHLSDWEAIAEELIRCDPNQHLRSIHHCMSPYDASRPWVTHVSWQRTDLYKSGEITQELISRYHKPVVMDEIAYEGNIQYGWGNLTGEELVRRFWETALRGGYPGHGETFLDESCVLWWSHGGVLHGESPSRIAFLADVLATVPGGYLKRSERCEWDEVRAEPDLPGDSGYILCYYSFMRPSFREFRMHDEEAYLAEVIDTWNMTIERAGIFQGHFRVSLPARPYMAIRLTRVRGI